MFQRSLQSLWQRIHHERLLLRPLRSYSKVSHCSLVTYTACAEHMIVRCRKRVARSSSIATIAADGTKVVVDDEVAASSSILCRLFGGHGSIRLSDCLQSFCSPEPLTGANRYYCEHCKGKHDAGMLAFLSGLCIHHAVLCVISSQRNRCPSLICRRCCVYISSGSVSTVFGAPKCLHTSPSHWMALTFHPGWKHPFHLQHPHCTTLLPSPCTSVECQVCVCVCCRLRLLTDALLCCYRRALHCVW